MLEDYLVSKIYKMKLIKIYNEYLLLDDEMGDWISWNQFTKHGWKKVLASTPSIGKWHKVPKIKIENIESLINKISLDDIALNMGLEFYIGGNYDFENGIKKGYQKALDDNSDKIFTKEDAWNFYLHGANNYNNTKNSDSLRKNFDLYLWGKYTKEKEEWDAVIELDIYKKPIIINGYINIISLK